jgi:hypothetical protein
LPATISPIAARKRSLNEEIRVFHISCNSQTFLLASLTGFPGSALLKLLIVNLEEENHTVICASDGVKGLELSKTYNFDMMYLNFMMFRLDWYESAEGPGRLGADSHSSCFRTTNSPPVYGQ